MIDARDAQTSAEQRQSVVNLEFSCKHILVGNMFDRKEVHGSIKYSKGKFRVRNIHRMWIIVETEILGFNKLKSFI